MKSNRVDFVIPWVDGSDPAWLEEKNRYLPAQQKNIDASDKRFRDWDNLKYWFRGVEKYAPWADTVHFVTWGHIPQWMNTECPKLHIVRHEEYIPEQYLPVFSANPIELNFHRIEGLADQFVYFNDDMFLTAPVKKSDFFVNGLPCDSLEEEPMMFPKRDVYDNIRVNDIVFCNRHFKRAVCRKEHKDKWYSPKSFHALTKNVLMGFLKNEYFFGFNYHHLPQAFLKKTLEEVWEADYDTLHNTCTHRFRNDDDVTQHAFKFWQLLKGDFAPFNVRKFGRFFLSDSQIPEVSQVILNQTYHTICINDGDLTDFDSAKAQINAAFEKMLPEKSQFERR